MLGGRGEVLSLSLVDRDSCTSRSQLGGPSSALLAPGSEVTAGTFPGAGRNRGFSPSLQTPPPSWPHSPWVTFPPAGLWSQAFLPPVGCPGTCFSSSGAPPSLCTQHPPSSPGDPDQNPLFRPASASLGCAPLSHSPPLPQGAGLTGEQGLHLRGTEFLSPSCIHSPGCARGCALVPLLAEFLPPVGVREVSFAVPLEPAWLPFLWKT